MLINRGAKIIIYTFKDSYIQMYYVINNKIRKIISINSTNHFAEDYEIKQFLVSHPSTKIELIICMHEMVFFEKRLFQKKIKQAIVMKILKRSNTGKNIILSAIKKIHNTITTNTYEFISLRCNVIPEETNNIAQWIQYLLHLNNRINISILPVEMQKILCSKINQKGQIVKSDAKDKKIMNIVLQIQENLKTVIISVGFGKEVLIVRHESINNNINEIIEQQLLSTVKYIMNEYLSITFSINITIVCDSLDLIDVQKISASLPNYEIKYIDNQEMRSRINLKIDEDDLRIAKTDFTTMMCLVGIAITPKNLLLRNKTLILKEVLYHIGKIWGTIITFSAPLILLYAGYIIKYEVPSYSKQIEISETQKKRIQQNISEFPQNDQKIQSIIGDLELINGTHKFFQSYDNIYNEILKAITIIRKFEFVEIQGYDSSIESNNLVIKINIKINNDSGYLSDLQFKYVKIKDSIKTAMEGYQISGSEMKEGLDIQPKYFDFLGEIKIKRNTK